MLEIREVKRDDLTVLACKGQLVAAECDAFRNRVRDLVAAGALKIEIDLLEVGSIDSAGIGLLAAVHNSVSKIGGKLVVRNVAEQMYQFLVKLRLNSHFEIQKAGG